MTIVVAACPLCESQPSQLFDRRQDHGLWVENRLCRQCGLVYQSPRLAEDALAAFYAQEYRVLYQGQAGPNAKDLAAQTGRARSLLAFTSQRVAAVGRHLDIGCSAGILLETFREHYGCAPVGVEPGEAYRHFAQGKSLPVAADIETLLQSGEAVFDLISLAHVLEHLPHPAAYLSLLRQRLLAPGGWLLLETPNLYAHDCFEVAHLVSFSAHSLLQTLAKAGFTPVALQKHGAPRSQILPLYLTVLAQPGASPADFHARPERAVMLKRRLGFLRRRLATRLLPQKAWLPRGD